MASAIVREGVVGVFKSRVIRGWRAAEIDTCLDSCARVVGYFVVGPDSEKRLDAAGRMTRIYADDAERRRMWARQNQDKARENSKRQWEVLDARYREQYALYREMFVTRFPSEAPVGYDRWRRYFYKKWLSNPEDCMISNLKYFVNEFGEKLVFDGKRFAKSVKGA